MSRLFWLTEDQVERISPFFPKERGVGRANDRKVLSGIIYVIKNGLQWADAPIEYGPHKTLYNRFRRWSENGVFERIFEELAKPQDDAGSVLMIDAMENKVDFPGIFITFHHATKNLRGILCATFTYLGDHPY